MQGILNRLGLGAKQTRIDPITILLQDAAHALHCAQARIDQLTEALQEFVDLSDGSRPSGLPEVKRVLSRAKSVLASRNEAAGHPNAASLPGHATRQ
jgi:hypothetical protein